MLKKVGNFAIMILLVISTGGIPIYRHYCGTTEKSISVFSTPKACCNGHCDKCHNVFKFSKVSDSYKTGTSVISQSFSDFVMIQSASFVDLFDISNLFPFSAPFKQRAIVKQEASDALASFGNFRC